MLKEIHVHIFITLMKTHLHLPVILLLSHKFDEPRSNSTHNPIPNQNLNYNAYPMRM